MIWWITRRKRLIQVHTDIPVFSLEINNDVSNADDQSKVFNFVKLYIIVLYPFVNFLQTCLIKQVKIKAPLLPHYLLSRMDEKKQHTNVYGFLFKEIAQHSERQKQSSICSSFFKFWVLLEVKTQELTFVSCQRLCI